MMESTKKSKLQLSEISVAFNGTPALQDVSLELRPEEIVGLIGPNGAGKTTLINVASGYCRPDAGTLLVDGDDLSTATPEKISRAGVARTFQAVRLFGDLTVAENVEVAALAGGMKRRSARARSHELLSAFGLLERAQTTAKSLPYGDERRLALARSVALEPNHLLLDEPAAGLNELETDQIAEAIADLPRQYGCGLLVVEHDMRLILGLSHRVHVLAHGRTIASGPPEQIRNDPVVIESYLGERGAKHVVG